MSKHWCRSFVYFSKLFENAELFAVYRDRSLIKNLSFIQGGPSHTNHWQPVLSAKRISIKENVNEAREIGNLIPRNDKAWQIDSKSVFLTSKSSYLNGGRNGHRTHFMIQVCVKLQNIFELFYCKYIFDDWYRMGKRFIQYKFLLSNHQILWKFKGFDGISKVDWPLTIVGPFKIF